MNVMIEQVDCIVAGPDNLVIVAVVRGILGNWIIVVAALVSQIAGIRHQEDIAEIRAAGSAEMKMREADENVVRVVICGTPIPTLVFIAWTKLDRAERYIGSHEYVPMSVGTDQWINVLR